MSSKSDYQSLIEKAGFLEFLIIEENADRYFSNVKGSAYISSIINYLPDNLKGQFRIDVIEQIIQETI
ncbi:MAG: hypothetical protein ACLR9T_07330 [Thomasclavelia sp.]|uniref:hypothetical protein n=1 Tax=Thomasclavelia sp. TaxID=3025757 RepID=UPI00399EF406